MLRQPLRAVQRPLPPLRPTALLVPGARVQPHPQQHPQQQRRAYRPSAPRHKFPPLPPFSSVTHSDPRIDRLLRTYFKRVEEGIVPPAAPMAGQLTGGEMGGGSIFCNNSLSLDKVNVIGMGAWVHGCVRAACLHMCICVWLMSISICHCCGTSIWNVQFILLHTLLHKPHITHQKVLPTPSPPYLPFPKTDYDYTLVSYSKAMEAMIYEMARDHLVDAMAYPAEIKQRTYDPSFAIR